MIKAFSSIEIASRVVITGSCISWTQAIAFEGCPHILHAAIAIDVFCAIGVSKSLSRALNSALR